MKKSISFLFVLFALVSCLQNQGANPAPAASPVPAATPHDRLAVLCGMAGTKTQYFFRDGFFLEMVDRFSRTLGTWKMENDRKVVITRTFNSVLACTGEGESLYLYPTLVEKASEQDARELEEINESVHYLCDDYEYRENRTVQTWTIDWQQYMAGELSMAAYTYVTLKPIGPAEYALRETASRDVTRAEIDAEIARRQRLYKLVQELEKDNPL